MKRTQLYLDDHLRGALHSRAPHEKTTVSELVRQAVRERYIGNLKTRKAAMRSFVGIRKAYGKDRDAREGCVHLVQVGRSELVQRPHS